MFKVDDKVIHMNVKGDVFVGVVHSISADRVVIVNEKGSREFLLPLKTKEKK